MLLLKCKLEVYLIALFLNLDFMNIGNLHLKMANMTWLFVTKRMKHSFLEIKHSSEVEYNKQTKHLLEC